MNSWSFKSEQQHINIFVLGNNNYDNDIINNDKNIIIEVKKCTKEQSNKYYYWIWIISGACYEWQRSTNIASKSVECNSTSFEWNQGKSRYLVKQRRMTIATGSPWDTTTTNERQ